VDIQFRIANFFVTVRYRIYGPPNSYRFNAMHVVNADIEEIFRKVADLLDIQNANPFRIRAYRNAAVTIGRMSGNVADMVARQEDLTELPGIGADLSKKILEIVETGRLRYLDTLEKNAGASFSELMDIPGLGPRKVRALYDALGTRNIDELEAAAREGEISSVPGFGEKTEQNILKEISRLRERSRRLTWHAARQAAAPLVDYMRGCDEIRQVEIAGSFRRCRETVGDLDLLVSCRRGADAISHFTGYDDVSDILSSGTTRSSVVLRSGLQVDLRVIPQVSWGAALLYFTGSKQHNIAIRKRAISRGLKINEYGVFRDDERIAGRSEKEVYASLGLPLIPPEIREDRGEIDAAEQQKLPALVRLEDIRGDLHMHTTATDGHNSIREMAEAAKKRGYDYIAITEHSRHVRIAHGLDTAELERHIEEIDSVNEEVEGITVLKGVEVDILEDGSLDLPDTVLQQLDIVICAVHYQFNLSEKEQTRRIIRAMEHPLTQILAHPTGRLLSQRDPYEVDMEQIMNVARQTGCVLELNAAPERLDLNEIHCRMAKEHGVRISIDSDAHATSDLEYMAYGINQARRGWLEPADVINTRRLGEMLKLLK
jgi:DNA polymerase (family X)